MNPKISVDYDTLKAAVRQGLSPEAREYWWPILSQVCEQKFQMREYPDIKGSAKRLLELSKCATPTAALRNDNSMGNKHCLLLEALITASSMGESPIFVEGFLQIISETIPGFDVCHLICRDVLESNERQLSTTTGAYYCKLHIFREIVKKSMPRTYEALSEINGLKDSYLNLMFIDFFKTLLPKESVLRLVDAYLLEGDKVLIRYGLALISGYKKALKQGKYSSADDFWQTVQSDAKKRETFEIYRQNQHYYASNVSAKLKKQDKRRGQGDNGDNGNGVDDDNNDNNNDSDRHASNDNDDNKKGKKGNKKMTEYMTTGIHSTAFDQNRSILKKISKPLNVSRGNIIKIGDQYYSQIKKEPKPIKIPFFPSLAACCMIDSESDRTSTSNSTKKKCTQNMQNMQNIKKNHNNKNHTHSNNNTNNSSKMASQNDNRKTISHYVANQSTILTPHTAAQLLSLCCPYITPSERCNVPPPIGTDTGLHLLFSTATDGFSLSSLYERVCGLRPLVILIKSIGEGNSKHVIGAYISESFKSPSLKVIGNGESFLFRLQVSQESLEENKAKNENNNNNEKITKKKNEIKDKNNKNTELATKFPWAKISKHPDSEDIQENEYYRTDNARTLRPEKSSGGGGGGFGGTSSQFSVFSPNFMSFGASEGYGSNAIRVDSDLSKCDCGPSDTYGNSSYSILGPLGDNEEKKERTSSSSGASSPSSSPSKSHSHSFTIDSVEVYSDKHSLDILLAREMENRRKQSDLN